MIKRWRWNKWIAPLVMIAALMLVISGCSALKGTQKPLTSQHSGPATAKSTSIYRDFGDVLIPGQLSEEPKESFVIQTPGMVAGVMSLSGRVEPSSLVAFFQNNMAKDNWRAVTSFKSKRTMMLYQKDNRWCVINITPRDFSTHVEIWVAPTTGENLDSGLIK